MAILNEVLHSVGKENDILNKSAVSKAKVSYFKSSFYHLPWHGLGKVT